MTTTHTKEKPSSEKKAHNKPRGPQVSQTDLDKERAEGEGMGTAIHPHLPPDCVPQTK